MDLVVRIGLISSVCLVTILLAGCGADRSIEAADTLPSSGTAYRALDVDHRTAVAAGCRDRVAATTSGEARVGAVGVRHGPPNTVDAPNPTSIRQPYERR